MTAITITLLVVILMQAAYIAALQRSPMGVLTPTALRIRLAVYSVLRIRCFVLGIDIRKMKTLNECGSHSETNAMLGQFLAVLRKNTDIVGQFGGDEFVIVGRGGEDAAENIIRRLLSRRDEINLRMPVERRQDLVKRTNGLVDGLHVAVAYVTDTQDAYRSAITCIDATETVKSGGVDTGDRDTSGKPGTLIMKLA